MLKETKLAYSFCFLLLFSCSNNQFKDIDCHFPENRMFAETKPVLTYPFHELDLADIISLVIMLSKGTNVVKKKLISAGIAETFRCLIARMNKKSQKLSERPNCFW